MNDGLEERIQQKKDEIENYKGVLERYKSGRWMNMGKRHLEELKSELKSLYDQQNTNLDDPHRTE